MDEVLKLSHGESASFLIFNKDHHQRSKSKLQNCLFLPMFYHLDESAHELRVLDAP